LEYSVHRRSGGSEETCSKQCLHPMENSARAEAPPLIELRVQMVGSAGPRFAKRSSIMGTVTCGGTGSSTAPVRRFRLCFATPDTLGQPDHFPEVSSR